MQAEYEVKEATLEFRSHIPKDDTAKLASRNGSNAEVSASYSEGRRRSPEEYEEEEISQMSDLQRKRRFDYYYWTPAITIEKDILCFIKRINHFQYILQPDFP